ncbi:MAG: hypothetical protein H6723_07880 [Sandaracinus sp.]|nr:hypothetical protein [Sandaracinus sp.]
MMRAQLRLSLSAALLASASACGSAVGTLPYTAARELECTPDDVTVHRMNDDLHEASGCERVALYYCGRSRCERASAMRALDEVELASNEPSIGAPERQVWFELRGRESMMRRCVPSDTRAVVVGFRGGSVYLQALVPGDAVDPRDQRCMWNYVLRRIDATDVPDGASLTIALDPDAT